jgi:2'-5' RNA ligase
MRCFIAIDFPDVIKEKIAEIQVALGRTAADVKWVNPQQIHLTLYFFKELSVEKGECLSEKVKNEVQEKEVFELTLRSIGSFPPSDDPRVIWIGVQDSLKLTALYEKTQEISQPFNNEQSNEERKGKFTPHVTIGRVRSRKNVRPLKELIRKFSSEPVGICPVEELIFFESRLSQKGPDYFEIHRFPLKHQPHL